MEENIERHNIIPNIHNPIVDGNNNLFNHSNDVETESDTFMYTRGISRVSLEIASVNFMQSMGLLSKSKHCCDCNREMELRPSETIDLFKWICIQCRSSCSIRQDSPFASIDCRFEKIIGILRSWCNNEEIDRIADTFGVKTSVVMQVYSVAGVAAENHIKTNITQWKVGGPGIIVLIDTFPEAYLSENKQSNRPILCLAELKGFPMTIGYHSLHTDLTNQQDMIESMKNKCQSIIRQFVHPESAVVARRTGSICSYQDIVSNQPQFHVLASYEGLLKHESAGRSLQTILSTIWEGAVYVCMSAQYYPNDYIQSFLLSHMWKNKFRDRAFPSILQEIAALKQL